MASTAQPAAAVDWPALARQSRRRRAVGQGVLIGGLALVSLPILLPYLWMLVLALTAQGGSVETTMLWRALAVLAPAGGAAALAAALAPSPRARRFALVVVGVVALGGVAAVLWPALTVQNFRVLWNPDVNALARGLPGVNPDKFPSVWVAFGNSLAFAVAQTALVLAVATPAGYALSRYGFGGRATFLQSLLVLHAFPAMTLIIPIFLIMYWSGLLDTLAGVALVVCTLELPFAIFIMKGFFDGVPWDIEMSAMADGATRLKAFVSVVLPQVRAGLLAVGVFTFLRGWEEYVFVRTLLYAKQNWTMSLYLFWLAEDVMGVDQGLVAGVAVLYVLPALVLYVVSQRYLLQMTVGGIKG